tara:strand:+ start:595 stop:2007 length:1413 start_codon:yes stop_codon:yes gene_type:complete
MNDDISSFSNFSSFSGELTSSEKIAAELEEFLIAGNYDTAKLILEPSQPVDIAEAIGKLPQILQALAFRLLKKNEAIEVYEYLDPIVQQTLLDRLRSGEVLEIVEKMSPDDRVQLFDELPAKVVRKFLSALSPGERKVTAELLGYEPETAGRLMTTEFIDLKEMQTAQEALSMVRKRAPYTETIYSLYVTDKERHLTGILSLRDLVTAEPQMQIGEVMTREVVNTTTDTNQEEAARAIQRYDFLALPVVDKENRLVGIVTVDDLIDVIEQEATRDIYAAGAVQAGDEDDYFQSGLFVIARRRIVWLLILVLANGITTKVIAMNDQILGEVVILAAFIPLLIGTGGNVGAQSSTVVIRGLSTQKIKSLGAFKAILKESLTGALLGILMLIVVIPFAWWQGDGLVIGLAVGISLLSITTLAATAGALLPLMFDRMGLDPALMSSPFITTATDIAGVFIYLNTATWLVSNYNL